MPAAERASAFTWDDFVALPPDDRRELIDGRLLEIDVPTAVHEWIVALLVTRLTLWALERRAGVVLASACKVRIRSDRGVMPDLQFFKAGRVPPRDSLEHGAPDLAVEIVSPTSGRFDRVEKLDWYASIGVGEYWIVDPQLRMLEQLIRDESGLFRIAKVVADAAVFEPETLPGVRIELAQLWEMPGTETEQKPE